MAMRMTEARLRQIIRGEARTLLTPRRGLREGFLSEGFYMDGEEVDDDAMAGEPFGKGRGDGFAGAVQSTCRDLSLDAAAMLRCMSSSSFLRASSEILWNCSMRSCCS